MLGRRRAGKADAAETGPSQEGESPSLGRRRGRARRRGAEAGDAPTGLGGRGAAAAGTLLIAVARLVQLAAGIVALIIAAAILFRVLDANSRNSIVSAIHDAGRSLVGPFDGMFKMHDAKAALAVNWGIALLVYLVVGALLSRLLRRLAAGGPRRRRDLRERTA